MKQYTVRDGDRVIEFTGVKLASVTSSEPGKTRWIELALFRTRAGMYVLEGVGKSVEPGEVDRPWVQQSEDPGGIIDRLYLFNDDTGAKYIPHTSRRLLEAAGAIDDNIRRAYVTEHVA